MAFPFYCTAVAECKQIAQLRISGFVSRVSKQADAIQQVKPATDNNTDTRFFCGGMGPYNTGKTVKVCYCNLPADASIFVVKLVRAHGGCLGTRSR